MAVGVLVGHLCVLSLKWNGSVLQWLSIPDEMVAWSEANSRIDDANAPPSLNDGEPGKAAEQAESKEPSPRPADAAAATTSGGASGADDAKASAAAAEGGTIMLVSVHLMRPLTMALLDLV